MKQGLISLVLVCIIIFELQYFNVYDIYGLTKSTILDLKRSDKFLLLIQASFIFVIIGLVILYFIQKKIESDRVVYNFSSKKSRSEYEKELKRETRKSVDALINSEAYKRHKQQYNTSEDFVNQRNLAQEDELSEGELSNSDISDDSSNSQQ